MFLPVFSEVLTLMKEYRYIEKIKSIIDNDLNIIGDDTAIIKDSGLVMTIDTLVDKTHFDSTKVSFYDIGYKAAAVNLSDIAASGGTCNYLLVSIAMPQYLKEDFFEEFYKGMKDLTDKFNCSVVGGDLTSSKHLVITVCAIGYTKKFSARSNAKTGQKLVVTGDFGASFCGLNFIQCPQMKKDAERNIKQKKFYDSVINKHLLPYPRIDEAQYLVNNTDYDSYCIMDTSDGIADALYQISRKSNKRLNVDVDAIPIEIKTEIYTKSIGADPKDYGLFGGEDFELLFTCEEQDLDKLLNNTVYKYTVIGDVIDGDAGVTLNYKDKNIELDEEYLSNTIAFRHFEEK